MHTCCGIPRLCTSAHTLLFIRTYIYILHTYVCADVRICLDVCTHVRSMYVYTYIVMYMWIHTVHTYVPICSCIYILSVNVCKFSFYVCMYICYIAFCPNLYVFTYVHTFARCFTFICTFCSLLSGGTLVILIYLNCEHICRCVLTNASSTIVILCSTMYVRMYSYVQYIHMCIHTHSVCNSLDTALYCPIYLQLLFLFMVLMYTCLV